MDLTIALIEMLTTLCPNYIQVKQTFGFLLVFEIVEQIIRDCSNIFCIMFHRKIQTVHPIEVILI